MPSGPSIFGTARAFALDLEALVLPKACLGCEEPMPAHEADAACCALCLHRMRRIGPPRCARCGQPLDRWSAGWTAPGRCEFCAEWPAALGWAASAVWLEDGPARNLVRALKYGGWHAAAAPMAAVMARALAEPLAQADALVPVPLGRARLRERGGNQAELLARALGRVTGLPVLKGVLARTRETRTQTRLRPADRRRNVAGAFVACGGPLDGMHVALVDDVVTTGATLAEAAGALAAATPARIGAVTFARAPVPS